MDPELIYNVPHAAAWRLPVAQYLWLVNASVGALWIAALGAGLGVRRCQPCARNATRAALALLAAAAIGILLDLEQPLRFWHVFAHFNAQSPMSWGAWLLAAHGLCCLGMLRRHVAAPLAVASILLGLGVSGYTGVLLWSKHARVLWQSPLLPLYAVSSAAVCGTSAIVIAELALRRGDDGIDNVRGLTPLMCGSLAASLALILLHLGVLALSDAEAALAAKLMSADAWFLVAIGFGHVVPLIDGLIPRSSSGWSRHARVASAAAALLGALCLWYSLLSVGQTLPLS